MPISVRVFKKISGKTVLLRLRMPNFTVVLVDAGNISTRIEDLKQQIVDEEMTENMSANMIKLSFAGKVLEDGHTLADYSMLHKFFKVFNIRN